MVCEWGRVRVCGYFFKQHLTHKGRSALRTASRAAPPPHSHSPTPARARFFRARAVA
jgi:hypothetical protein